jgi:ferredoxin
MGLQVLTLIFVVGLAVNGLGLGTAMSAKALVTFRKTNLTTLIVWGLWWPAMIAVVLVCGRVWCTVCPLELLNRIGDGLARRGRWPRARLGKTLRSGWMIVALYGVLLLLVAVVSLHRVPHYTAVLIWALLGGALLTGMVFSGPRSFCRAFCPAGALLSIYGRYTPLQLEARNPQVCENCATQDCIREENRYRFDGRSCPSLLRPFDRQPSDGCVLCLQCAKVCPHDNIGVGLVAADAPMRRKALLKPYEALFVMILLGFVVDEMVGSVAWLDAVFAFVPHQLAASLSGPSWPAVSFGWFEAFWFLFLFPFGVWGCISIVGYLAGHRAAVRSLFVAAATGAAPVVAVAHLAKAVDKFGSWGGFLPGALRDPQGVEIYHRFAAHSLSPPSGLFNVQVLAWGMLVVLLAIGWRALQWARQVPAESKVAARVGTVVTTVLFSFILVAWALSSG